MPEDIRWSQTSSYKKRRVNILALFGILIIILAVPVTVLISQYQQIFQQHAQLNNIGPYDSCKKLYITWQEDITGASSCPQGQKNPNVTSYGVTIHIKSNDSKNHTFHYIAYKGFCPKGQLNPPCVVSGTQGTPGDMTVSSTAKSIVIPVQSPTTGSKCGTYQDDFVITTIDGSAACHYGDPNSTPFGSANPGGAGFCSTGTACPAPSPSPSPQATPTPTPTPTQACTSNILFDAKNSTSGANVTQVTWKHTTGSHTNTILLVGIGADNGNRNTTTNPDPAKSVTYNGTALTKVLEKDCNLSKCSGEVWYMMNPPQGQHDVVVTLSAAGSVNAGSATFYNINPTNPFESPVANVNNGDPSVTVQNTTSSQLIVDLATLDDDASALTSGSGSTNLWSKRDSNQLTISGAQYTPALDGSTTVGWKANASYPEEYSDIAVPLNALSSSCATPTPTPPGETATPTPTPPACPVNQSVCQWQAGSNVNQYQVTITDITTGQTSQQTINSPQTFANFPTVPGHSYTCSVSGANSCGVGQGGTATFTCNQPTPTPTACPAPPAPNVHISCPNCSGQ